MNLFTYTNGVARAVVPVLFISLLLLTPLHSFAQTATNTTNQAAMQAQIETLIQQIAALQMQLAQRTGGTGSIANVPGNYTFTRNLSQGMSGQDVQMLQRVLNANTATMIAESGPGSPGNETMFFGPLTRDAVNRFQSTYRNEILTPLGISNPTGFVGASTRAKLNSLTRQVATTPATPAPTTPAPTTPDSGLAGGEGEIAVVNRSSSSYEVRLGAEEVVYEADVTAVDSDVAINRVDVHFSGRPWLYFDQVRLLADGRVVATLDDRSTNFTSVGSDTYRARFSNLNTIIREGDEVELTVEVKVKSALAGSRVNDTLTIRIPNQGIRMVDGAKITGYGPDGAALAIASITFEDTFGTATLNARISSDSPDATPLVVDTDVRTTIDNVLTFRLEAKDQAVTIDDMDIRINTGTNNANQVVNRVRLYTGNTLLGTQTVASGSGEKTVTFTNLNRTIPRNGDTTFRVSVEFNRSTQFTVPGTLELKLHEVRGESADSARITKSNLKIGENVVHTIITDGSVATSVSKTVASQANETVGTFTFSFDLTAFGTDVFISEQGMNALVATTTTGTAQITAISIDSTATLTSNGNYRINEGQTRRFTVQVVADNATANGFNQVTLNELVYGTSDVAGTPSGSTLSLGTPDYRSPSLFLRASN